MIDARKHATDIKELTASRQMPPWLAEPGHGDFQDCRRLSDAEIRMLAAWVEAGAPDEVAPFFLAATRATRACHACG